MLDKYKVYYEIAIENYKEYYEIYSNLIDKASKLLTFITIISGGLLFLLNWFFVNYNSLGEQYGYITLIIIILIGAMVVELGIILWAMYVKKMEKIRIKPEDEDFFLENSIEAVYYGIANRYIKTNNTNYDTITRKAAWLGYAQKGLFILIFLIILGVILILKLKK